MSSIDDLLERNRDYMRTYVVTGGTDGMGRGLGLHFLGKGDRVIAVASGETKGRRFLEEAAQIGAADRASFMRADLSTIPGMRETVKRLESEMDRLDGLVFATQRFQPKRVETADGLEYTFALSYLSRFVIGHGLLERLERADRPVIFNLAAPDGIPGEIDWDDLQLRENYKGMKAATQTSRALDLLGADFQQRYPDAKTRYVLYNPMFVKTAMAEPLPQPVRAFTNAMAWLFAQRVEKAIVPMARIIEDPPNAPLSAYKKGKPLSIEDKAFDPAKAGRLHEITTGILAGR